MTDDDDLSDVEKLAANYNWTDDEWVDITSLEATYDVSHRFENGCPVVPTGIPTIDTCMWGLGDRRGVPQGSYVIVGGKSNVGKTQFGLHMLLKAANTGVRAGMLSLDMRMTHASMRLYQAMAQGIDPDDWIPSNWTREHTVKLERSMKEVRDRLAEHGAGVAIFRHRDRTLDTVLRALESAANIGIEFVVVDHVQKIQTGSKGVYDRAEEISEALDWAAERHNVTVCALSQLNRAATSDNSRRPSMADLWGGTAMESNAHVVIVCDHSRYERDKEQHNIGRTYLLLEKNQFGPKGFDVPVRWDHAKLAVREREAWMKGLWPGDE